MSKNYRTGFERLGRIAQGHAKYEIALEAVKNHFIGFTNANGYDLKRVDKLSDAQKHQIRRYYNMLTEYTEGGPVYKMKQSELPRKIKRTAKNIDKVKRAAQMHEGRKRSKYIFIRHDGSDVPEIGIRNGVPVIINKKLGYYRETIEINKKALADDAEGTIKYVLDNTVDPDYKYIKIIAGKQTVGAYKGTESLTSAVIKLQNKYNDPDANNYYGNWLDGISVYYSDRKVSPHILFSEEMKEKNKYKEAKHDGLVPEFGETKKDITERIEGRKMVLKKKRRKLAKRFAK